MTQSPIDQKQREQALDTNESFIVQAPAGSGKTYLLTQRYLKLLAEKCSEPETILALTFTKKAANEMRSRILLALKKAKDNSFLPNETTLAGIAQKALARDQALHWDILQNPHRLRIQTLDAFNLYLAQQLPITSRFGTATNITDSSQILYQMAARRLLQSLQNNEATMPALSELILHLDNNYQRLEELLSDMLSHRDQWLPLLVHQKQQQASLSEILNDNLAIVIEQLISEANDAIPNEIKVELLPLLQFASNQSALPPTSIHYLLQWRQIAVFLLTKEGEWRKTVNKNHGFPSASDSKNPEEKALFQSMKKRMEELLLQCREKNDVKFKNAFTSLLTAPDYPYSEEQLNIIAALFTLLPILTAELMLLFKEQQCVDFIEIQQRALLALGEDGDPTDVTLKLDHKIEHILIDEFQDTSISQFQLLQKITQGFVTGDGRTIFLVGDPMQSIYGFRAAEVGIFLQVKYLGIGDIKPTFLQLQTNFRSHRSLVQFYNQTFEPRFPIHDNIHEGAISYAPSEAFENDHQALSYPSINQCDFEHEQAENNFIVEQIKKIQCEHPNDSIVILVQKRFHLQLLLPLLQQQKLAYQAIDIENLAGKSIISDLYALTRALLFLHDRISWLSILRAPWCGLTLIDLHGIANTDEKALILEQIKHFQLLNISDDAKKRLAFIVPILLQALQQKQRYNLRRFIENTWILLGGRHCLTHSQDLEYAEQFFLLLERHEHFGDLLDLTAFEKNLEQLYARSNATNNPVQIMTIHKSKGLEFDHVFLPFLNRKRNSSDKKLLMWLEKFHPEHQRRYLVLAPFFSKNADENPRLQNFVKSHRDQKTEYEKNRLMYVAYTRAKKSLYLSQTTTEKPDANIEKEPITIAMNAKRQVLEKLPAHHFKEYQKPSYYKLEIKDSNKQTFGTMIHQLLQYHGEAMLQWNKSEIELVKDKYPVFAEALEKIISNLQNDQYAKWIFNDAHRFIQKEFSITTMIDNQIKTFILDRTFVDAENNRWIIDFKTTSIDEPQDLNEFLKQQKYLYQSQLERYAQLFQKLDHRVIYLGLYFPLIPAWYYWQFEPDDLLIGKVYGESQ